MGAIAACTFAMGAAIVGLIYFTIQDRKEAKRAREAKEAENKINS